MVAGINEEALAGVAPAFYAERALGGTITYSVWQTLARVGVVGSTRERPLQGEA